MIPTHEQEGGTRATWFLCPWEKKNKNKKGLEIAKIKGKLWGRLRRKRSSPGPYAVLYKLIVTLAY